MVSTTPFIEPDLHARELDVAFLVNLTENPDFRLVPPGAQPTTDFSPEAVSLRRCQGPEGFGRADVRKTHPPGL